ncbi:MAG: hypothetical protein O7C55_05510 [Rickettsia endosymbiont of Ixodes persulcatus]|nr:hypothetical protein [Rickettsia endosymbiont of Ixodes persulcatus]
MRNSLDDYFFDVVKKELDKVTQERDLYKSLLHFDLAILTKTLFC